MNARAPRAAASSPELARSDHLAMAAGAAAPPSMSGKSPENESGLSVSSTEAAEESKVCTPIISTQAVACNDLEDREKQVSSTKALFALNGWALFELADGSFLASAYAGWPPKPLPDLQSAMRFLRRTIGGAA